MVKLSSSEVIYSSNVPGEEVRAKRSVAKGSFLQLMISASHKATGKPFTDVEIVQQALTFLLAG